MRKNKSDTVFDIINITVMVILLVIWAYPLYFVVIASISDPYEVAMGKVVLLPSKLTLEAYTNAFRNNQIWVGYRNTVFYTVCATAFSLFLTIPAGYVLGKKHLPFRTFTTWIYLFTMFFGGGLVPTYLLIRNLGILNTPWVMIITGGVSIWNVVVTRTFFTSTIPDELFEAGKIDGAGEIQLFLRVALPLAPPIIAVMALFYAVGNWNSYFGALIYISSKNLEPLQLVLRRILILNETALSPAAMETADSEAIAEIARRQFMAEGMKYSVVFIASAPLLCAYPFVQKYFIKGVMIGSLKG